MKQQSWPKHSGFFVFFKENNYISIDLPFALNSVVSRRSNTGIKCFALAMVFLHKVVVMAGN